MGYLSQVRAVIYGSEEALTAYITQSRLLDGRNQMWLQFKDHLTRYVAKISIWSSEAKEHVEKDVHVLDLYGDGWKWYEGYEDVQAWESFMCEAEDHDLDYEFVRIGEDHNDIEIRNSENSAGLINVSTVITDDINKQGENIALSF